MSVTGYTKDHNTLQYWLLTIALMTGLYLTTRVNYLLFHSLAELFSIVVAATVFIITWNSVRYIKNPYLIMVGISYLFVGILDLLHTLAYKGMPIFTDYDYYANQLWIAARFLESCTLLTAFALLFAQKNVKPRVVFAFYTIITALLIASILYWKIFPVCFVAGTGLTDFKVYSEYVICTILGASIVLLVKNKDKFADSVYKLLLLSMVYTIISELAFTFYIDNFGISNIIGHYFKLFSFMMIYRAIVATGIEEPYQLIFKELNLTNENLRDEIALRQQTDEALQESTMRFRLATEATGVGVWEWNVITNQLRWDSQMFRIYGIAPTEDGFVSYSDWSGAVLPEELRQQEEILHHTARAGGQSNREFHIVRRNDGECRFIMAVETARTNVRGEIEWVVGTNLDTTSRLFAEQEITRGSLRLRAILDNIPMMAWLKDTESRLEMVNEPYASSCGCSIEECIGKTDLELYPEEMARGFMADDHDVCITGRKKQVEETIATPDGVRWHFTHKTPIFDEQGTVVGTAGIAQDITERKLAEKLLREGEKRFRDIANASADWIWEVDKNANYIFASGKVKDVLGYEPEDILGSTPFDLMPPDERERVRHEFQGYADRCEPFHDLVNINVTRNGQLRHFLTSGVPVFNEQGELCGYRGVDRDVTERKRVEDAIIELNEDLEKRVTQRTSELAVALQNLKTETAERIHAVEALREKEQMLLQQSRQAAMGEMIGNIAHQWRQPLNTLGLFTQRLGMFYGTPGFSKEFLDGSVEKSMEIIRYMSKTIDDFRDYFKPDKEKSDFNVGETIKNTLSLLEGSFQNPKITIDIIEHVSPVISGYRNEFAQVLLNIMVNARDAIIERKIDGAKVTISICSEGDCTVITIADNAGGIPEEIISKVFDPYFTTKGPHQGTGVGLFMSKAIIEKNMDGKLTVRNSGNGAEFRIEVGNGNS